MKGLRFQLVCLTVNALIIAFAPTIVKAHTCVWGIQSGHWTLSGSPYIVQGAIEIPDGETLIIDPGVTVFVAPTTSMWGGFINVYGGLIATNVTFTGFELDYPTDYSDCLGKPKNEPGAWVGIRFYSPKPGSMLKNCRILYSGGGSASLFMTGSGGLKDSNLTIEGCLIAYGASDGIRLNTGASPIIRNTTIKDHAGYGIIEMYWNCDPVVEGCAITGCGDYAIINFADNVKNYRNLFIHQNNPDAIRVWGEGITSAFWENHGVPYHGHTYHDGISLYDGETLTLEPGVEIQFARIGLYVAGTLVADGDSCQHIVLTALDPDDRPTKILTLTNPDAGTILNYCDISYGGGREDDENFHPMLSLSGTGSNVVISNCQFIHSNNIGISISGESAPIIVNSLISDCRKEAFWIGTSSSFTTFFRHNLIQNNLHGMVLWSNPTTVDLGTLTDMGHNAFVNNTEWAVKSNAADTIFAIGNYWVDTDSAIIDSVHIYDDDEEINIGPVMFIPFDFVDQSKSPQTVICPPTCEALSITITMPTSAPMFQSTSRFIALGGTAADDHGVAGITWTNSTTGDTGEASLAAPRTNFSWTAAQIPLVVGENIITVKAFDLDQCTTSDEIIVTLIEQSDNCWAFDNFDDLPLGSLHGKNGWFTVSGRSDAMVVPDTSDPVGVGNVLELDPAPGQQIGMEKIITSQIDSVHTIELLVRVEPGDTSMAKLEVRTNGSNWDKKFQLYFGTSMRLNYGPTQPEAIVFLLNVEPQRWYHVKAVVDLETDYVDLFLDDILVLDNIAVNPGPITTLSISAWDLPGSVLFDDIHGCKLVPITHVELLKSPDLPRHFSLSPNYPNPFNLSTTFRFALPMASEVMLVIYDLFGKEVSKLVAGRYEAGIYSVSWDGRNNLGRPVSSGVYFIQMRAGGFVGVNKMTLVK